MKEFDNKVIVFIGGYRDYNCDQNIFSQFICNVNMQFAQETIKNFYYCLNQHSYIYEGEKNNKIQKKLVNNVFPLFKWNILNPIRDVNLCM